MALQVYAINYSELYIFCILLMLIVLYRLRKNTDRQQKQLYFMRTVIYHVLFFGAGLVRRLMSILLQGPCGVERYIMEMIYFSLLNLCLCQWAYYACFIQNRLSFRGKNGMPMLYLPFGLLILLNATSQWTHVFYYVDRYNVLVYAEGYIGQIVALAVILGTIAAFSFYNIRYEESHSKKMGILMSVIYALLVITAEIIRFALGLEDQMPDVCIAMTIGIVNIYINNLTQQISMDPLTQINNRNQLVNYIQFRMETDPDDLVILMMDVNHFKSINDKYGHVEGDAALVKVSDSLRQACVDLRHRPFISRYGGDEFIIVAEMDDDNDIQALCSKIHRTLTYYNTWSNAPYDLTMSIGVAKFKPEYKRAKDFITAADEALYEEKKHRK